MTPLRLVVITDLDGTLLDQVSYSYQASLPAVRRLLSLKVPLLLCSSKTRGEMQALWEELGLRDPFIAENGGAIYFPAGYFPFSLEGVKPQGAFEVLPLGRGISILRRALGETAAQCGVRVSSFGAMGLDEIATLTGLPREQAALAARREYDEPFVVQQGEPEKLFLALRAKGFNVIRGDRFSHLTGGNDKGRAARILLDLFRRAGRLDLSVGLGNSANDLSFLRQVDRPVVIRNPDGSWDAEIAREIPTVRRSQGVGPGGWREAIEEVLDSAGFSTNSRQ